MAQRRVTVWYDSQCPLCRRETALLQRLDRRGSVVFVDLRGAAGQSCPVSRQEALARFHALEDGGLVSGAVAFAAMWRAIPLLRPLGLLARNRRVLTMLEALYLRFLIMRPRLQRWLR